MITRIARVIQPLVYFRSAQHFSKFGNPRDRNKGQRNPFFGEKKGDKHKKEPIQSQKGNQSSPFRKAGRQPYEQVKQADKETSHTYQKEVQSTREQEQDSNQFITSNENEQAGHSIFYQQRDSLETRKPLKLQQKRKAAKISSSSLNMKRIELRLAEHNHMLQEKLIKNGNSLLELFVNKDWYDLQQQIEQYEKISSRSDVLAYVHPILAARDVQGYVQWFNSTSISPKELPDYFTRQIIFALLAEGHIEEVKDLCQGIQGKRIGLELSFLDSLFNAAEDNVPVDVIKSSLSVKTKTALSLLKFTESSEKDETEVQDAKSQRSTKYQLGPWFSTFWSIAKHDSSLMHQFIQLFEQLVLNHNEKLIFSELYSTNIFLDIIQTFYFGSHINEAKISKLFSHIFTMDTFLVNLDQLKNQMRFYWLRKGLVPFPNANNFQKYLRQTAEKDDFTKFIFYYTLCEYNNEIHPFELFENNRQLLNMMTIDGTYEAFINQSLLNLQKESYLKVAEKGEENEEGDLNEEEIKETIKRVIEYDQKGQKPDKKSFFAQEDAYLWDYLSPPQPQPQLQAQTSTQPKKKFSYKEAVQEEESSSSESTSTSTSTVLNAANMQFLHRSQLRIEAENEPNFYRKEVYKVLINNENVLDQIKSAIKLDKLELAHTIMKQGVMRTRIRERMTKNIDFVVKKFLMEHHRQTHHQSDIHQICDGISMKMIEMLDYQGGNSQYFLESIWQKMENFDHLMKNYMPQGQLKHQYWESTLMIERAQDIIKKDISGQLDNMKYEPQFQTIPKRKVKQFNSGHLDWRSQLIYGLGISLPDATPTDPNETQVQVYSDHQEFHEQFLQPLFTQPIQYQGEVEGEQAQGQALEEEGQQAEGEEGEAAEQVEQIAENEEVEVQAEQEAAVTAEASQAQASTEIEEVQVEEQAEQSQPFENIFNHALKNNINGYDFNLLLEQSRTIFRPLFEKDYDDEKEFIRHMLAMEAIAEQAQISDNHALQKKYNQSEETIRNPVFIAKLGFHGLYNYDFVTVSDPAHYPIIADEFRKRFFGFKKFMGAKPPKALPNLSRQNIFEDIDIILYRTISADMVEELLLKRYNYFLDAEAAVKIEPIPVIQDLIIWGVHNDEPMAVYLGQKLAMVTNQKISHPIALAVSQYLSHKRPIPNDRIVRCKEALKIVGKINREHIYELNKEYEHITVRKHLRKYMQERGKQLDFDGLSQLTQVDPTYSSDSFRSQAMARGDLTL